MDQVPEEEPVSDPARQLVCGVCHRTMAASEVMAFNAGAAKRADLDAICPACADGPSRRRILGRAPEFYIVLVADSTARDRCVDSYLEHGWTMVFRDDTVVRVRNRRRQIAVEIGTQTMSVGESALRSLDPSYWSRNKNSDNA